MFHLSQLISHCIEQQHPGSDSTWVVQNHKVDACIYHPENIAAGEKKNKKWLQETPRPPQSLGIDTRMQHWGYPIHRWASPDCSLRSRLEVCVQYFSLPAPRANAVCREGARFFFKVSLHAGRRGLPCSPRYAEAKTSRWPRMPTNTSKPETC